MNRSDFLRKLGIGIGVAVVAPTALAIDPHRDTKLNITTAEELDPLAFSGHRLYLANGDFYYETQETFHKNDVLTLGNNDKYVVTSENNGWYFLEKA